LYGIWGIMKSRCGNPNTFAYDRYGGRGIAVCEEWNESRGFAAFKDWALANGYQDDLTIDRIDNDGNYTPENCRWVDMKTQANNRKSNVLITIDGRTQNKKQWADEIGVHKRTFDNRLESGWDFEKILTKKVNHHQYTPKTPITFNNKTQTLTEWAEEIGITPQTLYGRLNTLGWSIETALTNKRGIHSKSNFIKPITFNNKTQTLTEWADEIGITPHTLYYRTHRLGWSIEESLSVKKYGRTKSLVKPPEVPIPVIPTPTKRIVNGFSHPITFNGKTQTIKQWSTEIGISKQLIYERLNNGWTVEKTLTKSIKNRNEQQPISPQEVYFSPDAESWYWEMVGKHENPKYIYDMNNNNNISETEICESKSSFHF